LTFYYEAAGESPRNLELMRIIDGQFLETPFFGSRQMARWLRRQGHAVSRKRVARLYLLKGLAIDAPNQVWCADVCYITMRRGFLYLMAIMDWYSRKVPSWRLSNTLEADFCVAALREALARYGSPGIFNTDQGCQFTSIEFVEVLKEAGVRISMDSKGRWMDNIMIEWLWRSLKYECVYLHAFETGNEAKARIGRWVTFYNEHRPYSRLDDKMHDEAYSQTSWTRPPVPVDSQATA
jgi:putative transposase